MTKTNIRPLGEYVLIEPEKPEQKTDAGIYLPQSASEERPQQGKVVAVGDGENIPVRKGQTVIYKRYGGTEVKEGGSEYLLVESDDVIAVVER